MPKSSYFTGQPIFSQLLKLIGRDQVDSLARRHGSDRYCKTFYSYDHLVSMLYACFFEVSSLRELTTGLQANSFRLTHLGLKASPRRSTVADANTRRDASFFEQIYRSLYDTYFPDSRGKVTPYPGNKDLFIMDSTTITLFSNVMKGAGSPKANGRKKGGVKVHTLINSRHDLPAFVSITEARHTDVSQLQFIHLPKGSYLVLDKGYVSYKQFKKWGNDITWVTRLKNDASYVIEQSLPVTADAEALGVLSDQWLTLGRPSNKRKTPQIRARRVTYYDRVGDRTFEFITNDEQSSPEQIADYYKKRWQIELLFKRIKQRYPLRYFLGDSPNAIKIQIWCALICDLLIKIVKKNIEQKCKAKWSYANLSAMIKHHLMTYIDLSDFLQNPEKSLLQYHHMTPQMELWGLANQNSS
jgi:hypothetical protein